MPLLTVLKQDLTSQREIPPKLLGEFTAVIQEELYGHPSRQKPEAMLQNFLNHNDTVVFLESIKTQEG